jgi:hypothetical protein
MGARPATRGTGHPSSWTVKRGVELGHPAIDLWASVGVDEAVPSASQSRSGGEIHAEIEPSIGEEQRLGGQVRDLLQVRRGFSLGSEPLHREHQVVVHARRMSAQGLREAP